MRLVELTTNLRMLALTDVTVWFSYEVPIAFRTRFGTCAVRENVWGTTTAKHINIATGKDPRFEEMKGEDFEHLLNQII